VTTRLSLVPEKGPAPERLLTIVELADRLQVSRSKVERDILRGLPHLDLGSHHPGRRAKRTLRFSWSDVCAWYAARPARCT